MPPLSTGSGGGAPPRPPRRPTAAAAGGGGGDGGEAFASSSRGSGQPSLFRLIAVGVGLAAAAVAATPAALSTRPGTRFLCWLVSRFLGGRVAVTCDKASLAWTKPPEIVGLTVTPKPDKKRKQGAADGEGGPAPPPEPVLGLGRGSATASLASIAFTRRRFDVVLSQPYVDLFLAPDGRGTRLERALGGEPPRAAAEEEGGEDDDAAALADAETFGPTRRDPGPDPSGVLGPPVPQPFSAELRAGRVGVYVADGLARVPADAREVVTGGAVPSSAPSALGRLLGKQSEPGLPGPVHATVLVGHAALEEDGDSLGWDGRAWDDPGGDPAAAAAVLVGGRRGPSTSAASSSSSAPAYDASWARHAKDKPRSARAPVALTLRAPGLRAQASGWIAGGGVFAASPAAAAGGLARGWLARATGVKKKRGKKHAHRPRNAWSLHLRDPGLAVAAACTPALARSGLARLSPLLADAVGVQDAASIRFAIAPEGGSFPSESADVRVASLKLRLGAGNGGGESGGGGRTGTGGGRSLSRRLLSWLGATTSARLPRDGVLAWTAPVSVRAGANGLTIPRFDILLTTPDEAAAVAAAVAAAGAAAAAQPHAGAPALLPPSATAKGVHLVTWGAVDPGGRRLALTVGVPGSTLRALGVRGVRPGALLPIAVRGPLHRPSVDFVGASARLAGLVAAGVAEGAVDDVEGVARGAARPVGAALSAVRRAFGRGVERRAESSGSGGTGPGSVPASLPWEAGVRLPPNQIGEAKARRAAAAVEER